jgi:hypothetical protein
MPRTVLDKHTNSKNTKNIQEELGNLALEDGGTELLECSEQDVPQAPLYAMPSDQ